MMSDCTNFVGFSIPGPAESVKSKLLLMSSWILVSTDSHRDLTTPQPAGIAQSQGDVMMEEVSVLVTETAGFFE